MMKLSKNNVRTLISGLALILLTNAFVLAGVAYNRSGDPESRITLTERELSLPYYSYSSTENTGISLRLKYRVKGKTDRNRPYYMYSSDRNIDWLDEARLASLGLDVSRPIKTIKDLPYYRSRGDEKEVIFVLEYDGSGYQAVLKRAEITLQERQQLVDREPGDKEAANQLNYAKDNLVRERQSASRLFIIDAGLDQEALRKQYAETSKYMLLKGVIGVTPKDINSDSPRWMGYVKTLSNSEIHVPLTGHKVLEPMMNEDNRNRQQDPPRYAVNLNIGKRLEPWVEDITSLEN